MSAVGPGRQGAFTRMKAGQGWPRKVEPLGALSSSARAGLWSAGPVRSPSRVRMCKDPQKIVGQIVAGYRLHKILGHGASAIVFRGESVASPGIFRAIKVIRPELAASVEFQKRFQMESRTLNELVHPHIVRFYSAQHDAAHGVLVMDIELLEGETLADRMKRAGPLSVQDVLTWVEQAARGVGAAHAMGVLHRDLKAENLFLTRAGVKVLDFGIAKAIEDAERTSALTKEGHVAGTAAYMAPEVWRGEDPSAKSDVYALGMTMAKLLLGRHPFVGEDGKWPTNHQLMYRHIEGELPRVRDKRSDVGEAVATVVNRALSRAESARFANANEMADAIGLLRERAGRSPRPRRSPRRSRRTGRTPRARGTGRSRRRSRCRRSAERRSLAARRTRGR